MEQMPCLRSRLACVIGLALAAAGSAAPAARAQEAGSQQLQFYLTPYLWLAGVNGTLKTPIPGLPPQDVSASFGQVLSNLNAIPIMGAAEIRYGRFGLLMDVMAISVGADVATPGPLYAGGKASLSQVIGSAVAAVRLIDLPNQSLDAGPGFRAFSLATTFTLNAGVLPEFAKSPGITWVDPIFAARYHLDLSRRWGLTAYGDVGGGASSTFTWQLLGTVDYHLSTSTTLRLGFRHMQFEYEGNVLHQTMGMNGPLLASTFRF